VQVATSIFKSKPRAEKSTVSPLLGCLKPPRSPNVSPGIGDNVQHVKLNPRFGKASCFSDRLATPAPLFFATCALPPEIGSPPQLAPCPPGAISGEIGRRLNGRDVFPEYPVLPAHQTSDEVRKFQITARQFGGPSSTARSRGPRCGRLLRDRFADLKSAISAGALTEAAGCVPGRRPRGIPQKHHLGCRVIPIPDNPVASPSTTRRHRKETRPAARSRTPTVFRPFPQQPRTGILPHQPPAVLSKDLSIFRANLLSIIGKAGPFIFFSRRLGPGTTSPGYALLQRRRPAIFQRHNPINSNARQEISPTPRVRPAWMVTPERRRSGPPLGGCQTRLTGQVVSDATISQMIFGHPRQQIDIARSFSRRLSPVERES